MKRILLAAAAALTIVSATGAPNTARAQNEGIVGAGLSGFALGVVFPFVNGYQFHPSGYWYVGDPRYFRYPVSYYKWYAPAQGYVYVGPNWRHWYQNREAVYAPQPYFVVPPKRYVYYPPVPYYYGSGYGPGIE